MNIGTKLAETLKKNVRNFAAWQMATRKLFKANK